MMTLRQLGAGNLSVPMSVSWHLSDIGEAKGRQELYTRQSPQKLKVLREHAVVESAISSNRIEGVEISKDRIGTVVFGHPALRDRNEQEVGGYRDALNLIHTQGPELPVTEETILHLHKLSRGEVWDAGRYKDKPVDIIETFADGRQRVRFRSVPPEKTPAAMHELVDLWDNQYRDHHVSPLVTMAAFNLDFLCIHPFRDGNGRASRLLMLLTAYHLGIEVGRYISLERLIEDNKKRYYETLQQSSQGWHEGKHDPWPYIGYVLYIFKQAYDEFERRAGDVQDARGAKTDLIHAAVSRQLGAFTVQDVLRLCPSVSIDMIRLLLKQWQQQDVVRCVAMGRAAKWEKTGNWVTTP